MRTPGPDFTLSGKSPQTLFLVMTLILLMSCGNGRICKSMPATALSDWDRTFYLGIIHHEEQFDTPFDFLIDGDLGGMTNRIRASLINSNVGT